MLLDVVCRVLTLGEGPGKFGRVRGGRMVVGDGDGQGCVRLAALGSLVGREGSQTDRAAEGLQVNAGDSVGISVA